MDLCEIISCRYFYVEKDVLTSSCMYAQKSGDRDMPCNYIEIGLEINIIRPRILYQSILKQTYQSTIKLNY